MGGSRWKCIRAAVPAWARSGPQASRPSVFRFLEHGEYKESLYGTSLDAIHAVLAKNKVCVVDVEPDVSSWASWACFIHGIYKLEDCAFYSVSDLSVREFQPRVLDIKVSWGHPLRG